MCTLRKTCSCSSVIRKFAFRGKKNSFLFHFFVRYLTFFHLSPKKQAHPSMCFGENKGFEHVTYFTRETKVSSYKVGAKSSIVTFVQGVIEFAMNENHRKTPE